MRSIFVLWGILLALCFFLQVEGDCNLDGETLPPGKHIRNCISYTCHESGVLSAVGCATWNCVESIGYREQDLSKPYPECCPGPICKSS
ncbi:uncharacterized protein LOC122522517 [Polistes fuscatus]|uniref:uncharacterized protein LOC122522517 n=1 Tax=Polistes fuscatus TaxID=30207 RepID=UPI001CA7E7AF|nr:uncharacterized protein LOC122522517 [Polistes fuscatus]